jgi:hypothetical protein
MATTNKKKTFLATKGHCPVCNSTDLDYENQPEFYGETYTFAFECEKCETVGREEYGNGEFLGFNIDHSDYFMGSKATEEEDDDFSDPFVEDLEEVEYPVLPKKKKGEK